MVDLTLINFEVTNEPKIVHSEAVYDILDQAAPLLKMQNGQEAERLFRRALELEPEQPDLLHYLAAALGFAGPAHRGSGDCQPYVPGPFL